MKSPFELVTGDSLACLKKMQTGSVQCVVTSPPYFGLRDYGMKEQIGLEKDLDAWVAALVEVFTEVRRVLRKDGTLWLNLGDSYSGESDLRSTQGSTEEELAMWKHAGRLATRVKVAGLKAKDLVGQPWMVAFALRASGWWLRADIIWSKTNPLPSPVQDRPNKSHEYVFLMAPSAQYYYDADGIREPYKQASIDRQKYKATDVGTRISGHQPESHRQGNRLNANNVAPEGKYIENNPLGRNRRTVWELSKAMFAENHTATFPEGLVEPCILAGTSEAGACGKCGAPLKRVVERGEKDEDWIKSAGANKEGTYHGRAKKDYGKAKALDPGAMKSRILESMRVRKTIDWKRTCHHKKSAIVPCLVLDPFSGSGTTGAVALRYGRRYIGIELNPEYQEIARRRLTEAAAQPTLNLTGAA